MTRIRLKSAKRKTQVSRAKVRSIMSRLFAQSQGVVKKSAANKSSGKITIRKPGARKKASRKAA